MCIIHISYKRDFGVSSTRGVRNQGIRMSTTQTQSIPFAGDRHYNGPGLGELRDGMVLRCRTPKLGDVKWYYRLEDGQLWKYHEWHGFERERADRERTQWVIGDPDVATAVVEERFLEWDREQ